VGLSLLDGAGQVDLDGRRVSLPVGSMTPGILTRPAFPVEAIDQHRFDLALPGSVG